MVLHGNGHWPGRKETSEGHGFGSGTMSTVYAPGWPEFKREEFADTVRRSSKTKSRVSLTGCRALLFTRRNVLSFHAICFL
jgi:hypothetical protein